MIENNDAQKSTKADYRNMVDQIGKKEFTLLKMQEYGFWPKDLPTPYEKQKNETSEQYDYRQKLSRKYQKLINQIADLYNEKDEINQKLRQLKKQYDQTWDYERIRQDISKKIMKESIERRAERKKQKEIEKIKKSEDWLKKKEEKILFIGKGYSDLLNQTEIDENRLSQQGLPIIKTDKDLAEFFDIEYKELRFLVYHRDVVLVDHYHRYSIPKKRGGFRNIASPKPILKKAQRKILNDILEKFTCSYHAHGFLKGKSVVSSADAHIKQPVLVINMDIEEFFPTITFQRVRGMFKAFGYSGYIASLLAMVCTYCERIAIEIKGKMRYVKTTGRILPQGSPASPMITNILCQKLDKRLSGLAVKFGFNYTRYADDMSFTTNQSSDLNEGRFCGLVIKILEEEGFKVNKSKTRFLRKNNRQLITGIVMNNQNLSIPKKWIKRFRAAVYNANKLKLDGKVPIEVKNEISGMAKWVKSVNYEKYKTIISAVNEVLKDN